MPPGVNRSGRSAGRGLRGQGVLASTDRDHCLGCRTPGPRSACTVRRSYGAQRLCRQQGLGDFERDACKFRRNAGRYRCGGCALLRKVACRWRQHVRGAHPALSKILGRHPVQDRARAMADALAVNRCSALVRMWRSRVVVA
jgi:hypothetical protein